MWAATAVRISKLFVVPWILNHQLISYRKNLERVLHVSGVEMNGLLALLAEKAKAKRKNLRTIQWDSESKDLAFVIIVKLKAFPSLNMASVAGMRRTRDTR